MRTTTVGVALLGMGFAIVAGCGSQTQSSPSPLEVVSPALTPDDESAVPAVPTDDDASCRHHRFHVVWVDPDENDRYEPARVVVRSGDIVDWIFLGPFHTVTSGTPGQPDGLFCSGVYAPTPWDCANGPLSDYGDEWLIRFVTPGVYPYYDLTEEFRGKVVVLPRNCPPPDAGAPPDLAMPPPADLSMPSPDLSMPPPADLSMPPPDLSMPPPADLSMPPPADLSMPPPADLSMPPPPDLSMPPPPDLSMPPQTVTVDVGPNNTTSFSPSTVDINVGDTVDWVWRSSVIPHTVASGTAPNVDGQFCSSPNPPSVANCTGVGYAATAPHSYSHQFTAAGTFPYFCTVHGVLMTGTVVVH